MMKNMNNQENTLEKKEKPEDIFDPDNESAIIIKDLVKKFDDVSAVNGINR